MSSIENDNLTDGMHIMVKALKKMELTQSLELWEFQ